ncbi:MAG: type II toxin-antitoxin system RelE/ParE family toxin [Rhodospirillaceae bacterium]
MEVRFTSSAIKELKRIGPGRDAILAKIEQYAADPTSLANNVKALRGSDQFRLRVGDHRVLFTVEEDGTLTVMLVEAIRHRREAYD